MGDLGTLLNLILMFGAIFMMASLSGFLSEKAGVVNIGIDGMMCFGALMFGIYSAPIIGISGLGSWSIIIPLLLTMATCMIMGCMHAYACINLKANHIIVGTAINILGLALAGFLNNPIAALLTNGTQTRIQSGYSPFLSMGNSLYGSSIIVFVVALIIMAVVYIIFTKTKVGLRYQAVGENPNAVDAQGISVFKYQWIAVLLSSAFAGLAGALFLFNVSTFGGSVQSTGYLGLAILIAGAWKLPWMMVFGMVFATFMAVASTTTFASLGIAQEITYIIPYVVTLVILIFSSKYVLPPAHSGIPFEKTMR